MFKYELDPTKIELKNTDFEHKLVDLFWFFLEFKVRGLRFKV